MNQFLCFKTRTGRPVMLNIAHIESISRRDADGATVIYMDPTGDIEVTLPDITMHVLLAVLADTGEYRKTYKEYIQVITVK